MATTSINNHHSPRQERRFARMLYIGLGFAVLLCFIYILFRTQSKPIPSSASPVDVRQELNNKDLPTTTSDQSSTQKSTVDRAGDTPIQAPDHK